MDSVSDLQASLLAKALQKLLRTGNLGDVAFLRCLPSGLIHQLCLNPKFAVQNWKVWGVSSIAERERRLITGDEAVELREDKGEPALFLIDVASAGAGLNGIYNAAREIGEEELFQKANTLASGELPKAEREFARQAVKQASKLYKEGRISPWRIFEFYTSALSDGEETIGGKMALLGLWPVKIGRTPNPDDLSLAVRMVERLFPLSGSTRPPAERITALRLIDASETQTKRLEILLRETAGLSRDKALARFVEEPTLWLHELTPGFMTQTLQGIELVPWRGKADALLKWSGLTDRGDEQIPEFRLNDDAVLEVRWETTPEDLGLGAIEYEVSVVTGDDPLATRSVTHTGKLPQKARFTADDFSDLEEGSIVDARIRVTVLGSNVSQETDEFCICFGEAIEAESKAISGKRVRTLDEGVVSLPNVAEFEQFSRAPVINEKKGDLIVRPQLRGQPYRLRRPDLLRSIEEQWIASPEEVFRWTVQVRSDGTPIADPQPVSLASVAATNPSWDRLRKAHARLASEASGRFGTLGLLLSDDGTKSCQSAADYVNAWIAALEQAAPGLALAHTLEVRNQSNRIVGLIVLPSHPIRLAWQMGYAQLAKHLRFTEDQPHANVLRLLDTLDGNHFPAMLPGSSPNESYVFADMLDFHFVAMVHDNEPEPRAAVALLAQCLYGETAPVLSQAGQQTADVLAKEMSKYLDYHPSVQEDNRPRQVRIHAFRPGDGAVLARALAKTQPATTEDDASTTPPLCFVAELYGSADSARVTGRFLSQAAERRRAGSGGISLEDRWLLESIPVGPDITIPRLRWARRPSKLPEESAHLAIAFDTFRSSVIAVADADVSSIDEPFATYGLIVSLKRKSKFQPEVSWDSFIPLVQSGEKHPAGRVLTERLHKLHTALLRCVARNVGGDDSTWPVLRTSLDTEGQDNFAQVHRLSDWVITVDRHVAIEYFDSPKSNPLVYDAHVIDCVPEREDLGSLQLVTSTANIDAVRDLLDRLLIGMGLSGSRRNCEFLLTQLKALSGRLAIRLASPAVKEQELIALALVQAHCSAASADDEVWLSTSEGFFVPLDDVRDLFSWLKSSSQSEIEVEPQLQADLLHVSLAPRSGLQFRFVEVRFRRHLRTARQPSEVEKILSKLRSHADRWSRDYFDESITPAVRAVRIGRLVRVLHFYLEKASRHQLRPEAYERLSQELNKLLSESATRRPVVPAVPVHRGYMFCPEIMSPTPIRTATLDTHESAVYLFGPTRLPDLKGQSMSAAAASHLSLSSGEPQASDGIAPPSPPEASGQTSEAVQGQEPNTSDEMQAGLEPLPSAVRPEGGDEANVVLGDSADSQAVSWKVSIRRNPHLMVVGLPGMGKTTCLINLCVQLARQGIAPIVFSYHADFDEKLSERLSDIQFISHSSMGFNPLRIDQPTRTSHIDTAGAMRDIFSAIFPDFGDIQTERIRLAIKQSYQELGWDGRCDPNCLPIPGFDRFFQILREEPKPDRGLLFRLTELDDYGLFSATGEHPSLLDDVRPIVLQLHATQNDLLQRSFASLMFYMIYKDMFRRGVSNRITHAVVFDEAHRAARLKLLPTMAKECRKYGLSLIVASQQARDFDAGLYSAIANYLILRVTEQDAKSLARNVSSSDAERRVADRLKSLPRYESLFFCEGRTAPTYVKLGGEIS